MPVKLSTLFLAGFTIVAAMLFLTELASFSATRDYRFRNAPVTLPAALKPAVSLRAIQNTLLACDRLMSSPYADFQIASSLQATARACADFAGRVTTWAPTHGFAFFVAAQAANIERTPEFQDAFLQRSQDFAPFEGWLAERRVALRTKQKPGPGLSSNTRLVADISTLLTTQSGAELLATFYLRRPELRATLARAAGQASLQNQTRFINQLQRRQAAK